VIGEELRRLLDPSRLESGEVRRAFDALVRPAADEADRVAILVALASRRSDPGELVAFAREMRRRARPFAVPPSHRPIDLCGSGGAPSPSFNVSTVAAFVVRSAGVRVVKHGNRSRRVCGSSDLLEALGLPVTSSPAFARAAYDRLGITFLHAPLFHPATAAVAAARQRLGIPTVFNRLGPLSNPARVRRQVSGAANARAADEVATVLRALGVDRGISMASDDGCDEFSPARPTTIVLWNRAGRRRLRIRPERYLPPEDRAGDWGALPAPGARDETERILAGGGGARRGSVLLTAGAALFVAGRAPTLSDGVEQARDALDRGAPERLLADMRRLARPYRSRGGA